MAIGNCDCCDRTNVPGTVVNCPGEPFACHICQGDEDADPYSETEIEQACPDCNGDRGWETYRGNWQECRTCDTTGRVFEQPRLVNLDDLSEMCGDLVSLALFIGAVAVWAAVGAGA
jgi:hypothetical protein